MGRPLNRIPVVGGAQDYQTFQIKAPLSTHWRSATCQEAECPNMAKGWRTVLDPSNEAALYYIRKQSGRNFKEYRNESGQVVFEFTPGQKCFGEHKVRLDREEFFIVKGGDHRGNPRRTSPRKHGKPADWVDEFANHQDKLKTLHERG